LFLQLFKNKCIVPTLFLNNLKLLPIVVHDENVITYKNCIILSSAIDGGHRAIAFPAPPIGLGALAGLAACLVVVSTRDTASLCACLLAASVIIEV